MRSIVIVGASLAGVSAASSLRRLGYGGQIALVGAEKWLPYERPHLSKQLLWRQGDASSKFYLHEQSFYDENEISLLLGASVQKLDLRAGGVLLENGRFLKGDAILLAVGGTARRLPLPGADAANVHYLRSKDDADAIARALVPGAQIAIVGMGVIGAEVAASAIQNGCKVVAIEPEPVPMLRTLGTRFGAWMRDQHRRAGAALHLGRKVRRLLQGAQHVHAIELDDGEEIACDAIVVGIGMDPCIDLARKADLAIGNGVSVDFQCRTSHPCVFAAGDVTDQPGFFGGRTRLETYQNACDQGAAAAAAMLGKGNNITRCNWFWSDQYELNIQVAGRLTAEAEVVVRGNIEANSFSAFFVRNQHLDGLLTVNRPDMGAGRRLIERRVTLSAAQLADPGIRLDTLVRGPASVAHALSKSER